LRVGVQFVVLEGSRIVGVGVVTGLLQWVRHALTPHSSGTG
jgi:hypothetical protein